MITGVRASWSTRQSTVAHVAQAPVATRSPASTGSVKSPMTLTEKILGRKTSEGSVKPGDNVWVNVDKLLTHDVCGPGTFGVFEKEFGANAKVRCRLSSTRAISFMLRNTFKLHLLKLLSYGALPENRMHGGWEGAPNLRH
jgi:plastocyanin